ncbi:DUF1642 domain-containing protein [Streptococcus dysgalactiae]|uniref:Phage protein n=1 Tax=Streptococcus dysgalactiae TaxID=1334 RepID=A0ABU0A6Y1_STRDY|nr:DUF1642 domain-containing protein [Streptococcus dysgalactiae]MDQ0263047.1 hypothetical protein [Streptococcus dysgalactiae]SQG92603.1 phage protein [Streptococcus dysgalactiae subsp. equisimilis]SUN70585.1 phage protein [Streptococcus dysgalactiae]
MNIEEAKEKIKEISYGTGIFLTNYEVNSKKVLEILGQIDQPKPKVPQCVADWYEKYKDNLEYYIWEYIAEWDNQEKDDFFDFMNYSAFKPFQTLVNMHQFGYTVKKEKLYKVRDKRLSPNQNYLNFDKCSECWLFSNGISTLSLNASHTRKALEESGFNVFDDDNYEVTEVAE